MNDVVNELIINNQIQKQINRYIWYVIYTVGTFKHIVKHIGSNNHLILKIHKKVIIYRMVFSPSVFF